MGAKAAVLISLAAAGIFTEGSAATSTGTNPPALRVAVDPRIELVSLLFRMAGNPEYNQAKVESYVAEVEQQFGKFKQHPAVQLAQKLRNSRGVSYDACMSLAVLLTDARQ